MKQTFLIIILCCISLAARAFTLSGKIKTDAGEALPYVSVYIEDVHMGATTDMDGHYEIKSIPEGHHSLIVSYVGYATQTLEFDLQKGGNGENVYRDFVMHEQAITLDNVFITPTGESLERFILSQVVKHNQRLSKRVASFNSTLTRRTELRDSNLKVLFGPSMSMIDPVLGLLGLKTVFHTIIENPNLKVEVMQRLAFADGNIKQTDISIAYSDPKFTDTQQKAWLKVASRNVSNTYDSFYDDLSAAKKKLESLDKKKPEEAEKLLTYGGEYEDNDKTIHIIKYKNDVYHIVDGVWQIRRAVKTDKRGNVENTDFCEFAKNIYMPVSVYKEVDFDFSSAFEKELKDLKKENTDYMKPAKLQEHNKRIADLEKVLREKMPPVKTSSAISYSDFKAR